MKYTVLIVPPRVHIRFIGCVVDFFWVKSTLRFTAKESLCRSHLYNSSKISPMKPVWVSCCCSGKWGSCACVISARRWISHSPRSPAIWQCSGKVDFCWIANRASGFITACPRIFLPGPLR